MYKYEKIKKETNRKLKEILTNKDEFIRFIKFFSNFYKYNFQNALCIYVQNENATAVAEYDTWKRIKFQVKRGEKGIGLFDERKFSKLRYVFDVSSTYQQKIKLWRYVEDRHKNILNLDFSKNNFIEKHPIENIEDESIKNLIYHMNKLAKNTRLGIETENFEKVVEKSLPKIKLQDIDKIFNEICSTISEDLKEIENTIKSYEENLLKEKGQENISIELKKEYIKQYFGKVILINNREYIIKDFFDDNEVELVDIARTMRFNYGIYFEAYKEISDIYNLLQDKNNIVDYGIKTKYSKNNIKSIFDEIVNIKQNKNKTTIENTINQKLEENTILNEDSQNLDLEKETQYITKEDMIDYINSNIGREINFKGNKVEIQGFDENLDKVILFNPNTVLVSDDDLVDIEEMYYFLKDEDKVLNNEQEKEQENVPFFDTNKNQEKNIAIKSTGEEILGVQLYKKLYDWGFEVFDNQKDYIELKTFGFDRLVLERIDDNQYSLASYSKLNDDPMRNPEITFIIENSSIGKFIKPTSFLDDYLGQYEDEEYYKVNPRRLESITLFFRDWLNNISQNFKTEIEKIKNQEHIEKTYNIGDTVILEEMVGENLPNGLKGTIRKVDDMGQIQVSWENGSSLAIDSKIDKFEVISQGQEIQQISIEEINTEEKNTSSFQTSNNYDLSKKKTPYPKTTTEKIQANINAIKTLLTIESESRLARPEEKEILANYVGWGGLPQVFEKAEDIKSISIREKAIELRELLTDEEYNSARASTLNAHYTPNYIIQSMYNAIKNFGYTDSLKILEPSCGIGNFIGNLPEELRKSKITGVELDAITGRIAKLLYPTANIRINGFEKEFFKENDIDLVVGNVPFGDYSIYDKNYNQNNYLIHDYFINKSIELAKPNGIVAVITSKGTLDKKDDTFRRDLSKKAELIGAIRLPNTTFKQLAGTEVVSDILFFQKLEKEREEIPDWTNTTELKYENRINNYFINNPEMILGQLDYRSNRYGRLDLTVNFTGEDLQENLKEAIEKLPKNIVNQENLSIFQEDILEESPIDYETENELRNNRYKSYRYIHYNDKIFYKHDDKNIEQIKITRNENRLIGMITLRDMSKELINIQLDRYTDESVFEEKLQQFNDYYDEFIDKYGYINNKTNLNIFKDDEDVHFLASLEKAEKEKYIKGDFFYKRTVAPIIEVTSVDNAKDGLILSLNKFADIDFNYIKSLYDKPINEIIDELIENDLIYLNPLKYQQDDITKGWEIKSVYLNGNVKEKLRLAESLKNESPYFERNIEKLKEVIPKDVDFADIKIDMGSDIYKPGDIKVFAKELLNLYLEPDVKYNIKTAEWRIYNKSVYGYLATEEYGTQRMGALYILEKMLNNQEIVIKDEVEINDTKRLVTNKDETIKANEKKILIERAFEDFIHQNKEIRDRIEKEYNERFNNSINANWDIELKLPNLSYDIKLRPHQKRAVARSIFSPNNLLLDHQVGAGKTFIMIVSAMEKKRLGIVNKPLLVVPNNITGQFKNDFYRLYPTANILYADEKSFETKNRKRFLSKIAQNDYDAVIMGQSQFDLLKISKERQIDSIRNQIDDIVSEMKDLNKNEDRLSIKILERTKKSLEKTLEKLIDSPTETILDFEQLGIDTLYIDEAHLYKNLYFVTKLRNVAGINQTNSQKAFNLKMKIDYLEEIGAKITFATGTPISNTMAEMYTMQRFLASEKLEEMGIYSFDAWQKIYANTETKLEISPAGNGFQIKTRFSNFRNIPELMNFYNSFADVITTEMINLPIPKYESFVLEAEISEELANEMKSFGERAERCKGGFDPREDNILKIVHEGRYAGLDIRHIDESYPDYEDSKVNMLVNKVFETYTETMENKSTQVIFSDLSTPKKDEFNIYDDIKQKLINKGMEEKEIAFVHSAKNSKEREKLFEKVRTGEIRVILGSTSKMGAGTNFQDKLIALYHLDTPWRPSDLEQREGRILRQGNENKEVKIYKCITKGSFDAYSWQILEQKQRFIAQAKTGAITGREVKDIDEVSIDYAEIKALATGNPLIKRKMEIDTEIEKLKVLETAYRKQVYSNQKFLEEEYPEKIVKLNKKIENIKEDLGYSKTINFDENQFSIIVNNNSYTDKEVAGELLIKLANKSNTGEKLGEYKGFTIYSDSTPLNSKIKLTKNASYSFNLNNGYKKGNIDLLDKAINEINEELNFYEERVNDLESKKELIQGSIEKEFEHKQTLLDLYKEKAEIEKSFDDENKTVVNFEIEETKEIQKEIYEDELEL